MFAFSRFTSKLAPQSKSFIALDFMQNFIDKNEEINGHMGNVKFMCMDVCKLELPENRYVYLVHQ